MITGKKIRYAGFLILFMVQGIGHGVDFRDHPQLRDLVEVMVREDGYPAAELEKVLAEAVIDPGVIQLINKPAEALPWHAYRRLFINDARVRAGADYWKAHTDTLARATAKYGVPPAVIVALLGVETHFGARPGKRRVLDSLVTLIVDYPRRAAFFTKELRAFLNTSRAEGIDPASVTGSYAGAVGIPQFMPTSYQAYAVDFNANGRRDLVNENADAIGSVANYLKVHGWRREQAIFSALPEPLPAAAAKLVSDELKPTLRIGELVATGLKFNAADGSKKMALLRLEEEQGDRHFLGFRNFYAITRYNPSVNYAMAVVELSQQIRRRREL